MMTFGLDIIADILLGVGALAAAFYCVALSRKLSRLTGLDQELGTAIAVLSQQVDEMTQVLQTAQASANDAREKLSEMTERAEDAAMKLQAETAQPAPAAQDTLILDQPVQQPAPDPEPRDSGGLADGNTSIFMRHTRVAS